RISGVHHAAGTRIDDHWRDDPCIRVSACIFEHALHAFSRNDSIVIKGENILAPGNSPSGVSPLRHAEIVWMEDKPCSVRTEEKVANDGLRAIMGAIVHHNDFSIKPLRHFSRS